MSDLPAMKARDVLAECDQTASTFAERDPLDPRHIGLLEAALLAQTPEGEGVYIAPDGTLMRACEAVATTDATHRRAWMGDLCECGADWPCPSVDPEEEP